jgi:uncharacterized membrane protein YfcA
MPEFDLSMLAYGLVAGLAAGVVGGMLAGLAGVGGGLIYAPLFYACMPDDADGMAIHVFASLVAVVITGFFSSRSHWRLGHIDFHKLKLLLPGLIVGAGLGLWSTLRIPEALILLAMAGLNGWVAHDYGRKPAQYSVSGVSLALCSAPIGLISGALGIGGGTMLTPLLRRFTALRMAVGTSAACGLMMAFGAVLMNVMLEPDWRDLLAAQWQFLAGAWLGVMTIMPTSVGWSARLHASTSEQTLRQALRLIFSLLSAGLFIAAMLA